jgi:hypothetical protein
MIRIKGELAVRVDLDRLDDEVHGMLYIPWQSRGMTVGDYSSCLQSVYD